MQKPQPANADGSAAGGGAQWRELIDAQGIVALYGLGMRTIRRRDAAGLLPDPIRIGKRVYWRRDELDAWLAAGAPDRATWNRLKAAKGVRR